MKKTYQKPGMYVENFSLSQSIATACGASHESTLGKPAYSSKYSCGWDMGNFIIWTAEACKGDNNLILDPDTPVDGVCYNNPNGGASIFSYS